MLHIQPATLGLSLDSPFNMVRYRAVLDGVEMHVGPGPNVFWVAPGRHRIDVGTVAIYWPYGSVSTDVDVASAAVVQVFYAAPYHRLSRGRVGLVPQSHPGLVSGIILVIMLVLVVFAFGFLINLLGDAI